MLVSWCDVPSRAQQHRSAASAHQDNKKRAMTPFKRSFSIFFSFWAQKMKKYFNQNEENTECVPLYRLAGQNKIMNVHNINSLFWDGINLFYS